MLITARRTDEGRDKKRLENKNVGPPEKMLALKRSYYRVLKFCNVRIQSMNEIGIKIVLGF